MVRSRLNSGIEYPDNKNIYKEDENRETDLFELTLHGVDITFGLGSPKRVGTIVFYPIYLIQDANCLMQIGVFEISAERNTKIHDENGEIDIGHFDRPLLYSFVNRRFLQNLMQSHALCEQSGIMAMDERKSYQKADGDPWVAVFLSNPYYEIGRSVGGLYDVLFEAFNKRITREQMQEIYADNVPEALFVEMAHRYKEIRSHYDILTMDLKHFVTEHRELKKKLQTLSDRTQQLRVVKLAETISSKHKKIVAERNGLKLELESLEYLNKITSFSEFQAAIQPRKHIDDIRILGQGLGVEIIIFSRDHFEGGDMAGVLSCNHPTIVPELTYEPKRYIMVSKAGGNQYALVTYKGYAIFDFSLLPYDVKLAIANKCLEGVGGNMKHVPLMKQFMKERHLSRQPERDIVPCDSSLYDRSTTFVFYDRSFKDDAPGDALYEVRRSRIGFSDLAMISDWRRMLANSWIVSIKINGKTWSSVDHYVNSLYFRHVPDIYAIFSLDSDTGLSKSVEIMNRYVQTHRAKKDPSFTSKMRSVEYERANECKFTQNKDLGDVLRMTRNALLLRYTPGAFPVPATDLMKIRHQI